jgi:Family of unknown function (DUF6011)
MKATTNGKAKMSVWMQQKGFTHPQQMPPRANPRATAPMPASDKQVRFLRDMIDGKDLLASPKFFDAVQAMDHGEFEAYKERLKVQIGFLDKDRASAWIEKLVELPWLRGTESGKVAAAPLPDLPEGHYAIEWGDRTGSSVFDQKHIGGVKFYHIDRPTSGKWDGYVFLSEQSGDNRIPIKRQHLKKLIMEEIALDPKAATLLFGHKLGICGVCNRSLTDADSRAAGIGPVCAKKRGWSF